MTVWRESLAARFPVLSAALWRLVRAIANRLPRREGSKARSVRSELGCYRIDHELGRGSMGMVYLGRDRSTGERVALKTTVLGPAPTAGRKADGDRNRDGNGSDSPRSRFIVEARAAAGLQHPGIVRVLEASIVGDLGFIAMEYVDGEDLASHALPGRLLPVPAVLRIVEQAARALAHAHRAGVVHRDIKPANLLLDAVSGKVKIADFGIARMADAGAWRTRTGLVLGSPAFMSPEQMAGRPVDGRTDLYALGVVLFLLLTGALPHAGESMGRLMHAIAHEAAADVRSLRPELPEALANIVAVALQKRLQLRYADGDQMADDLAAVLQRLGPQWGGVE